MCMSGIISSYVNRVRQHGVNEHRMTEDTLSVVSQYRPDLARAPKSVFKDRLLLKELIGTGNLDLR